MPGYPDPLDPPPPGDSPTSALSSVPAAGSRRGLPAQGILKYFYGPMDCGKSTMALQVNHNHARQGRRGLLLTKLDRSHKGQITSRLGLTRAAVEVDDTIDLRDLVRASWAAGRRVDYLIVDEAQFFSPEQIDQLAQLADDAQVDVYAFGIATDFRSKLFPGSQRLFELADEVVPLQVEVLCWCGRPGRFNARVVGGRVAREGATVVVADSAVDDAAADGAVRYQVLCRVHHRNGDLGPDSAPSCRGPPGRSATKRLRWTCSATRMNRQLPAIRPTAHHRAAAPVEWELIRRSNRYLSWRAPRPAADPG